MCTLAPFTTSFTGMYLQRGLVCPRGNLTLCSIDWLKFHAIVCKYQKLSVKLSDSHSIVCIYFSSVLLMLRIRPKTNKWKRHQQAAIRALRTINKRPWAPLPCVPAVAYKDVQMLIGFTAVLSSHQALGRKHKWAPPPCEHNILESIALVLPLLAALNIKIIQSPTPASHETLICFDNFSIKSLRNLIKSDIAA